MSSEVSSLPLASSEVEREIASVDAETARMVSEIARLALRKKSLLKTLGGLNELLGKAVPEDWPIDSDVLNDESPTVRRNGFRGKAPAHAARKFLQDTGHGVTHPNLVTALLKGNVKSSSRHPADAFRTAMQRHADWFVWKKEKGQLGKWELVEWQSAVSEVGAQEPGGPGTTPALALVGQSKLAVQK